MLFSTMQFSFIAPIKFMKKFSSQGDFILALAHLIDSETENEYEKILKELKMPIFLDNSLFENLKPEPVESLIKKAIKIKASAFFAPDHLYNAKNTKESIEEAYDIMRRLNVVEKYKIKLGAVVQGNNKQEWLQQFEDFYRDDRIDIIGLSILSIPHCFEREQDGIIGITSSRLNAILTLNQLKFTKKDCHLLGLGESYADVRFAMITAPYIKSNDSSSCFVTGLKRKVYTNDMKISGGKVKKKIDFNLQYITPKQKECIQVNINKVKRLQQELSKNVYY